MAHATTDTAATRAREQGRVEIRVVLAMIVVVSLIACMYWVAVTGNNVCCDPKSLVGQLLSQREP